MASIDELRDDLRELTGRTGKVLSAALIADSFVKGTAAVVMTMQEAGIEPARILRVQAAKAAEDPEGATLAIVSHLGPVVIEISRAMPIKLINRLMDNEILRRDERSVFFIFEKEEWEGALEFFSLFGKVGYAVLGLGKRLQ